MKTINKYAMILLMATGLIYLESCKKEEVVEQTQEEIFLDKITGSWSVATVMLDGKDVSQSFPGLKITISETKQITVTNGVPPIWKGSGTFTLQPVGNTYQLKRDDGVVMTLTQPAANRMILKFLYDATKLGGRTQSVTGEFTFEFTGS